MQRGVPLLMRAARELLISDDEPAVLRAAMRLLGDHYGYGTRYLLLRQGDELRTVAAEGPGTDTERARTFRTPIGRGLTGACAELREVVNVPDVAGDDRYVAMIEGTRSEICVPLVVRDDLLGVLSVESASIGAFTMEAAEELIAFAQLVAFALLHTRADAAQQQDIAEMQAISAVARRATDIVARYGGDEFVVLQPEAGLDAAHATAERIRRAASVAQDGIATSVSIGVASFPAVREADALFREADRALGEAKQRGKNLVVVAGTT